MKILYGSIIELIADEGKLLTKDNENYGIQVFLGKDDSPSYWYEVPQEEAIINE